MSVDKFPLKGKIEYQDRFNTWHPVMQQGNLLPYAVNKHDGALRTSPNKVQPLLYFNFKDRGSFPLAYFRSPITRDMAFTQCKNSNVGEKVKLSQQDFFSDNPVSKTGFIKTMEEINHEGTLKKAFERLFDDDLEAMNEDPFAEQTLTKDQFESILAKRLPENVDEDGLITQFANMFDLPASIERQNIPKDLFWGYFIKNKLLA